jgi:hypothetical protein
MRTTLSADVTYYVADTGSDATGDGSAGNPWRNISKAYTYARDNLDLAGHTVWVQLPAHLSGQWNLLHGALTGAIGGRSFIVNGDPNNPTVYLMSGEAVGAELIAVFDGAALTVQGTGLTVPNGIALVASNGTILFGHVLLNAAAIHLDAASPQALIQAIGDYYIVGVGPLVNIHAVAEDHGQIALPVHVTIAGTPTWNSTFAQGDLGGMVDGTSFSYSGTAYGKRYNASGNGIVFTGGSGGPNFFPGDTAGTTGTGGIYY